MNKNCINDVKKVKVIYTNPLGMQITVKKKMTLDEIRNIHNEGKGSVNKIYFI